MATGFRVRVRRTNDNVVVYDSEHAEGNLSAMFTDKPGPGAWSYLLEVLYVDEGWTGPVLHTVRNTIAGVALNR